MSNPFAGPRTDARRTELAAELRRSLYVRTDRLFVALLFGEWLVAVILACWVTPIAWDNPILGSAPFAARSVGLGLLLVGIAVGLVKLRPGQRVTRHGIAICQMLMGAILIHLTGGRIETHFHIFASLAFLAVYRDCSVLITASVVVVLDHVVRGGYWPESIYGQASGARWRSVEHIGWMLFIDLILFATCRQANRDLDDAAERQCQVEAAQASVEREVRELADAIPQFVWTANPQGTNTSINRKWREYTGLPTADVDAASQVVHPDDFANLVSGWTEAMRVTKPFQFEYRLRGTDSEFRWFLARAIPMFDEHGQLKQWLGTSTDIDEQKRIADELRASREEFRVLLEGTPNMVWSTNAVGGCEYLSQQWVEYTGVPAEEQLPYRWMECLHPDDRDRISSAWWAAVNGHGEYDLEYRIRRHDGQYRWFKSRARPVRDTDGNAVRWLGTSTDIHDQKRAEEEARRLAAEFEQRVIERTHELATEVEERRRSERLLRLSEERFELAVRGSQDGIWDWDLRSGQVYFSPRWKEMLGYSDDEIPSEFEAWRNLLHPDDVTGTLNQLQAYLGNYSPRYGLEVRMRHRDGGYRWIYTRGVALRDETGKPYRLAGSHTDVTPLKMAQEAAEAASRAKGEFLANMSHEIRTPMNGILGLTELLLESTVKPDQRESLRLIHSSAEALMSIINDVLDFSKIEAGKLDIDPTPFRMRELLNTLLKIFAPRCFEKGVALTEDVLPDVPDGLVGDSGRLRQILTNLVGNAVKFTESGEVNVTVERCESPTETLWLRFTVADTGIGIPAGKLSTIFEAFTQADGSTTRKYGGTGLGLTISARLVGLMGGRIRVESTIGKGSAFIAELPFGVASDSTIERLQESRNSGESQTSVREMDVSTRPLRVLLAEDNAVNQRVVVRMLAKFGHTVHVAKHGGEALQALDAGEYDVILMDVQMPEMDGFETTRRIRDRESGTDQHIPIIAMTAHAMTGDRERCLAVGMDDYLSKPVQQKELLRVLNEIAGSRSQDIREPAPAPFSATAFDREAAMERLGGDAELFVEVAQLFVADAPKMLDELRQSIAAADAAGVRLRAHGLKGAAGYLAASATVEAAQILERDAASGDLSRATESFARIESAVERLITDLQREIAEPRFPHPGA